MRFWLIIFCVTIASAALGSGLSLAGFQHALLLLLAGPHALKLVDPFTSPSILPYILTGLFVLMISAGIMLRKKHPAWSLILQSLAVLGWEGIAIVCSMAFIS